MKAELESPFLDAESEVGPAEPPWQALRLDTPYARETPAREALLEEEKGIIDGEDRQPVADPLAVPFRWICSIAVVREITHASGRTSRTGLAPAGTGVLISPRHVLTAAHVLKSVRRDSSNRVSERHEAQTVRVKFGRDASGGALVEVEAERWDWPRAQWKPELDNSPFDFALLTLKKAVGTQVFKALGNQALGHWGADATHSLDHLPTALAQRMLGARVVTAGYPDSGKGQMMCASGVLSTGQPANDRALGTPALTEQWIRNGALFSMTADATEGQSGSPVWVLDQGQRFIVGIAVTAGDSLNQVRGINPYLLRCLDGWMGKTRASHEVDEEDGESRPNAAERDSAEVMDEAWPDAVHDEGMDEAWPDAVHEGNADDEAPYPFASGAEHEADAAFEHDRSEVDRKLAEKDWRGALRVAIADGEHDESKLANLVFFARHPGLDPNRRLDPKASKEDAKLAPEWSAIAKEEVWPVIVASAEDPVLAVHGKQIASRLVHFRGAGGRRFKQLVDDAARKVDINPGLLAAALIGETGTIADYLSTGKVGSYRTGVDDFYAMRAVLAKNVPAYADIGWDKKQKPAVHLNDAKEKPREVQSIWFDSGADALLATAVYLKYGEVRLRDDAKKLGGDFDALPVETRFALVRMSMAAGRAGAAKRLAKALKGQDVLVRDFTDPVIYHTNRNATIRAAEAMFLSGWVFGQPLASTPVQQKEEEWFEPTDDEMFDDPEAGEDEFGDAEFGDAESGDAESEDDESEDDASDEFGDGEFGESEYRDNGDDSEAGDLSGDVEVRIAEGLVDIEHDKTPTQVREVVVGERIEIDLAATPFNGKIASVQWEVPGRAVRGYDGTVNDAKLFELTDADRTRSKIVFFWVDGGDGRTVRATIRTTAGASEQHAVVFDVKQPVVETFGAKVGKTRIEKLHGMTGMRLGKLVVAPGIRWSWKMTMPERHAGHIKDVQTVWLDNKQVLLLQRGATTTRTLVRRHPRKAEPHLQLDGHDAGQAVYTPGLLDLQLAAGESFTNNGTSDSPVTSLPPLGRTVSVDDRFTYFLMFKPDTAKPSDAIWVPVAKATWTWKATAKHRDGRWVLAASPTKPVFEKKTTDFPRYETNVAENEWQEDTPPASAPARRP